MRADETTFTEGPFVCKWLVDSGFRQGTVAVTPLNVQLALGNSEQRWRRLSVCGGEGPPPAPPRAARLQPHVPCSQYQPRGKVHTGFKSQVQGKSQWAHRTPRSPNWTSQPESCSAGEAEPSRRGIKLFLVKVGSGESQRAPCLCARVVKGGAGEGQWGWRVVLWSLGYWP